MKRSISLIIVFCMMLSAQIVFAAEEQYDYNNGIKVISDTFYPAVLDHDTIAQIAFNDSVIKEENVKITVNIDADQREESYREKAAEKTNS